MSWAIEDAINLAKLDAEIKEDDKQFVAELTSQRAPAGPIKATLKEMHEFYGSHWKLTDANKDWLRDYAKYLIRHLDDPKEPETKAPPVDIHDPGRAIEAGTRPDKPKQTDPASRSSASPSNGTESDPRVEGIWRPWDDEDDKVPAYKFNIWRLLGLWPEESQGAVPKVPGGKSQGPSGGAHPASGHANYDLLYTLFGPLVWMTQPPPGGILTPSAIDPGTSSPALGALTGLPVALLPKASPAKDARTPKERAELNRTLANIRHWWTIVFLVISALSGASSLVSVRKRAVLQCATCLLAGDIPLTF